MSRNIVRKARFEKDSNYSGECGACKRGVFSSLHFRTDFSGSYYIRAACWERKGTRAYYIRISLWDICAPCVRPCERFVFLSIRSGTGWRDLPVRLRRGRIHIPPIKISAEYARRTIWTSVFSRFLITVNLGGPLMLLAFNARTICGRCEFVKNRWTSFFRLPRLNPSTCRRNSR